VLRRRGYKQFEGMRFWLLTGLFTSPFFLFAVAAWLPLNIEFIDKLVDMVAKNGNIFTAIQFFIPLFIPLFAIIVIRFTMRATFILDDTGIVYFSGIPEKYQWIRLDWKYRWDDISAIVYKKQKIINPRLSVITLNSNKKTVRLVPWQWVDPNDPYANNSLKSQLTMSHKKIHQQLEETPMLRFFKEHGFLGRQPDHKDPADILNSNLKARIITGLFIVCIIYFIGDVFFGLTEYYVPDTPWHIFVLAGFLGAFIAHRFLYKESLRKQDSILMAVLFGLGIGLASYPLSIHASQWGDTNDLISYAYELREENKWYPVDSDMPVLFFDRRSHYWAQFAKGAQMNFELRQGVFGYVQINMVPIYADQKRFYEKSIVKNRN